MKVAIMYSGGKDSTLAIEHAINKGWKIQYLLSVKPNRTDCYLFHFATVEHTKKISEMLNLKHFLIECTIADPKKEAELIKNFVMEKQKELPIDALILGGTGLQETQLRSLQNALLPINIEVFASHSEFDHFELFKQMIKKGYKIMISQIASYGLDESWLGTVITKEKLEVLYNNSLKYGFHVGGEGGYFDTLVLDGPIFKKRLEATEMTKLMETENSGYVVLETKISQKQLIPEKTS